VPRAPKRCPRCREFQPCPVHPRGWAGSKSPKLPRNWKSLCTATRARVSLQRGEEQCEQCGATGKLEVDHIICRARGGTDDLSNLQLLCHRCHRVKTIKESRGWK